MIFHASIPADDPKRVATVIAELWQGEAFPFPPWPGGWVAMAGDDRNTTTEVYPRSQVIAPGEGEGMARPTLVEDPSRLSCFHMAIATDLSPEQVFAIGRREGWRTVRCNRGGLFDVIELWVEDSLMIEVLTDEMQRAYLAGVTPSAWRERLQAGRPGAPA